MLDFLAIEEKWRKKWEKARLFAADAKLGKKKFFCTFPYPYVNAFPHIGHLYTIMRVEALARYKRLQGYHVLFPQGWHATGTPIVSAAKRVKEKEEKQLKIMKDMGIEGDDLKPFEDPAYWVSYFIPEAENDYKLMGLSIDWRRQFYTTSLNPYYDRFVRWQFHKLKEKKFIVQGRFPVVWDPVENCAIGDHDRNEGEGEVPQEFLLVKHKLDDGRVVISATLRPDTILGVTNLYVNPKTEYVEAYVGTGKQKEIWILSEYAIQRLIEQGWKIVADTKRNKVSGASLIGKEVLEFSGERVLILPATFLDPYVGTGLVHSVPSDSADDLIALYDLQKDKMTCKKYELSVESVQAIKPIPCLETPEIGGNPAEYFLKKFNVKSQHEREKLETIKKELYKLSFYSATFGKQYTTTYFSKNYAGRKVEEAKDEVKEELIRKGWAAVYYQLTGRVVSRFLNECVVKIVDDQWFVNYSDPAWKKLTHECLEQLRLYPEKSRQQFSYVIDWLHNWACTREEGLGTRLPWDEKWLIESLSDSTIYMAYYTIVHLIEKEKLEEIDDAFFEYVFFGKGKAKHASWKKMHEEFTYWYPLDFRNSGKDLVQNHLTFFLFHHVALFPREYWPRGIGVNGWVTVDGEKMSKSKGNMIPLREMPKRFCVDAARFTILNGGESLDDPNWDSTFATAFKQKLNGFFDFVLEHYGEGNHEKRLIDEWMLSRLYSCIKNGTLYMEETLFRSASQEIFFTLQQDVKWYLRRTGNSPNKKVLEEVLDAQLIMLSVFCPFVCEELWEKLGKEGFVSTASWPVVEEKMIRPELYFAEHFVEQTLGDIHSVLRLVKIGKPRKITLFVALPWKYSLFKEVARHFQETRNPQEILKMILSKSHFKQYGKEISSFLPKLVASGRIPEQVLSETEELDILEKNKNFFVQEFNCSVEIVPALLSQEKKASQAMPGKVALLVE